MMPDDDLLLKTPEGGVDEPAMVQDADTKAAAKIARGTLGGRDPITLPTIGSNEDYQALMPGMKFKDQSGKQYVKPYKVESDEDYEAVPEGAEIVDSQGKKFKKPQYQGVDFTAQTLYDMAVNDKERRKALERSYPGKVKERAGKLYIDDDGTLRRPKGFGDAPAAGIAAAAAPTIGSIGGELLGAAAGTGAAPGPGTVAGAVTGGAVGGALGQGFNDIVMGLAGVYDRSPGEEAGEVALSGAAGGVGTAAGRGIAAVAPAIKGAIQQAAPKAAAHFLGADEEALTTAIGLRDKDVLVPPSTWAKESPHLANVAEVFDPAFRMQKPLLQSATAHYEDTAGKILEDLGVKPEGKISDPTTAPSTQKAGEAILAKRLEAQQVADKKLADAVADAQLKAAIGSVKQVTAQGTLEKTAAESRKAAQGLIDAGFQDIQRDVDTAMKTAKAGHNSGDLWTAVGDKLVKIRQGIAERAKVWYGQADEAAAGHLPDVGDLPQTAQEFLDQLPEPFQAKYPDAVKKLRDLAGVRDEKTGAWIKEPVQPTFGQLHELRTWFRSNVDYHDLTPGIRDGVYKFFAKQVDDALHPTARETAFTSSPVPKDISEINSNAKVNLGDLHRGVEGIADPKGSLRNFKGGDLGDGVYMTPSRNLAESYGGGPKAKMSDGSRKVFSYTANSLYPEDVAYLFGGKKIGSEVSLVSGNGIELYRGPWNPAMVENALGSTKVVIGTPDSIGANQVSVRDASILKQTDDRNVALQTASQLLDATDKWYGEQIRPLQDARIQAVMKGLESGLPADPKVLFDTLVKEGRTDLTRKVAQLIGPNLWAGVKAADVQQMLEASKSLVPDVIDGNAFTREVLSRHRSGMLEAVHGREASAKLLQQAQNIAMLNGKLDVAVRPGDTMTDIIGKAREAADAAKLAAEKDPLATLNKETKKIVADHQRQMSVGRKTDPLGFIYDPTVGAAKAVDHILGSEDLILAAGARFGEGSPEFNMLRQVWAQRILMGTLEPGTRLAKVSPEVQSVMFGESSPQNILFPGVTGKQMRLLAKEMDFLLSSKAGKDTAKSMAAVSKVEHPWASIPLGGAAGKIVPGFDAVGRAMLGKYFKFVTEMVNSPTLMRFVEKGLKGDPQGREMAKQAVQKWMQRGGAVGAGVGQAEFEAPRQ